jgi:hypothetical protein
VAQNATLASYSSVTSTVPVLPNPVNISAKFANGSLTLSGSGGPDNGTYYVIGTTNLISGAWQLLSTNSFDGSGNFNVSIPVNPANPTEFLRIKEQ